jgi:hypothetical protein
MNGKSPTNGGKQQHLDHGRHGWLQAVAHGYKLRIRPGKMLRLGKKLANSEIPGGHLDALLETLSTAAGPATATAAIATRPACN